MQQVALAGLQNTGHDGADGQRIAEQFSLQFIQRIIYSLMILEFGAVCRIGNCTEGR